MWRPSDDWTIGVVCIYWNAFLRLSVGGVAPRRLGVLCALLPLRLCVWPVSLAQHPSRFIFSTVCILIAAWPFN